MNSKSVQSINLCESVIQTIYDIIKAHGGDLRVKSADTEGTEMIIFLPIQ